MIKTHYEIPNRQNAKSYLNWEKSYFSVIVPESSVNLVHDPEMLLLALKGNTSYQKVTNGNLLMTAVMSADRQRRGLYGCYISGITGSGQGLRYRVPQSMTANVAHTFSLDHWGTGRYRAQIVSQAGTVLATKIFEGYNFWQRCKVTAVVSTATPVDIQVVTDENSLTVYDSGFWLDGFQFEQKPYDTTFISGDLSGHYSEIPRPYGWLGNPHNSASFRNSATTSGGRIYNFEDLGYKIIEFSGLGLPDIDRSTRQFAIQHGVSYGCARVGEREFNLIGDFCSSEITGFLCDRDSLVRAISPIRSGTCDLPIKLLFQLQDCSTPLSEAIEIDSFYKQGADLKFDNQYGERVNVQFGMEDPFLRSNGSKAIELATTVNVSQGTEVVARDPLGNWTLLPGLPANASTNIRDMKIADDGLLYAIVDVTGSSVGAVYSFDGYTWTKVTGAAATGAVNVALSGDFNISPTRIEPIPGGIMVLGAFTQFVGDAANSARGAVRYKFSTKSYDNLNNISFAGGGLGYPICGAYQPQTNTFWMGGSFSSATNGAGAVAPFQNVAVYRFLDEKFDTAMPGTNIGSQVSDRVRVIRCNSYGTMFVGGDFSTGASVATDCHNICALVNNGLGAASTLYRMDPPGLGGVALLNMQLATVRDIAFGPGGKIYVVGRFNNSPGNAYTATPTPLTNVAQYDLGVNFSPVTFSGTAQALGYGTEPTYVANNIALQTIVRNVEVDCANGDVHITGDFLNVRSKSGTSYVDVRSPAYAVATKQGVWKQPEIVVAPTLIAGSDPVYQLESLAVSGDCDSSGYTTPTSNSLANANVQGVNIGVPPSVHGSIFLGAAVNAANEKDILFPVQTDVDTGCSASVNPVIRVRGPGKLYYIKNNTTGKKIEFSNGMEIAADETITIDTRVRAPTVYSSSGKNRITQLVAGSNLASFQLINGTNTVSVLIDSLTANGAVSPDAKVWAEWRPAYDSIDTACVKSCGDGIITAPAVAATV